MAPKRNDPCHCGSGKKYKHCHKKEERKKEQAQKQAQRIASTLAQARGTDDSQAVASHPTDREAPTPLTPRKPRKSDVAKEMDPETKRLNQLYKKFDHAKYEEKIIIVRSAIEEAALDGELAFEFFDDLYPRVENIPLTKAILARAHFVDYIVERHNGELTDDVQSSPQGAKIYSWPKTRQWTGFSRASTVLWPIRPTKVPLSSNSFQRGHDTYNPKGWQPQRNASTL